MSDVKISGLPASTTPLAGTEVLPIVQGGVTKKVSVANLTAGRAIGMLGFDSRGDNWIFNTAGGAVASKELAYGSGSLFFQARTYGFTVSSTAGRYYVATAQSGTGVMTDRYYADENGNINLIAGNLVIGTSGKGIDFSATAGTGTSELLADYEEGTWTPVFASAAGTITSTTVNAAKYTKVGRLVTLSFDVTITNNGTGAVAINVTGLPYAAAAAYSSCGTLVEVAAVGFGGFVNQNSTTALSLVTATWTYPGGTNYRIIGSVAYNV